MVDLSVLARQLAERIAELDPEDEEDLIPDIEELVSSMSDEDELSERWVEEMVAARSESLQQLVLMDKRTGTPVSHRDVGIGVSQVLPVLVSAYASNNKLVAIEQPEIHLHPALQAELATSFWNRRSAMALTLSSSRPIVNTCFCVSSAESGRQLMANFRKIFCRSSPTKSRCSSFSPEPTTRKSLKFPSLPRVSLSAPGPVVFSLSARRSFSEHGL